MRRWMFTTGGFLWLAPILAVGGGGLGLGVTAAAIAGGAVALLTALPAARAVDRRVGEEVSRSRSLSIALCVAAAIAIVRFGAFAIFIADVSRAEFSVTPHDDFRLHHSCMSSYAESARFLHEGGHNIYERDLYRPGGVARQIGPLRVDPYHYPPPFLLLPQALRAVAPDFWDFRRLWFVVQALTLAGALVGLAAWIGGRVGAIALLGGIVLLTLPHVAFTFQQGNFQITAVPLSVLGFVLLMSRRYAVGGGVLAYAALAKIFPGVLGVPFVFLRNWRAVGWTAGAGIVVLAATVALQGVQPMRDFLSTSLPELSSGAAFPQTESPRHSRVNWSAYGQTVRLRELGVSWLTQRRGLMLTQVYGLLVFALAAWGGWRARFDLSRPEHRAAVLLFALGLIGLASFRSPFVGGVYGCLSTLWLMGMFAAQSASVRRAVGWLAALCTLAATIWMVPSPAAPPSLLWTALSGGLVTVCMALSGWGVIAAVRHSQHAVAGTEPAFAAGT